MALSPLHLRIALHYHYSPEQWPDLHIPTHREYAEHLCQAGLLKAGSMLTSGPCVGYEKTDGLAVWIEAILSTPFPVQQWVMPKTGITMREPRAPTFTLED